MTGFRIHRHFDNDAATTVQIGRKSFAHLSATATAIVAPSLVALTGESFGLPRGRIPFFANSRLAATHIQAIRPIAALSDVD
jgi:hypothetical protein